MQICIANKSARLSLKQFTYQLLFCLFHLLRINVVHCGVVVCSVKLQLLIGLLETQVKSQLSPKISTFSKSFCLKSNISLFSSSFIFFGTKIQKNFTREIHTISSWCIMRSRARLVFLYSYTIRLTGFF